MNNIIIILGILLISIYLLKNTNNIFERDIEINNNISEFEVLSADKYKNYDLIKQSNFEKPNNRLHHLFEKSKQYVSPKNKLMLINPGVERMYTKQTIEESLLTFVKKSCEKIIYKTTKLKANDDIYIKNIEEVYQKVDTKGNQRYIVKCFVYDIPNFYDIKIIVDFFILDETLYINYIGENVASNNNILNRKDYIINDSGYLSDYDQIEKNTSILLDNYYKKNYKMIGYNNSNSEYSHYISKLDTIYKFDMNDLSKYYLPPDIPQMNDPNFDKKYKNDWDLQGIKLSTGMKTIANNNATTIQPLLPYDSPATPPHTRDYQGYYNLQQVGFNTGGNVVTNSWYY